MLLFMQKTFVIVVLLVILSSSVIATGHSVAAQTNETAQGNSNTTNTTRMNQLDQTLTKKITVDDIDVGYRMFGNGDPLFLIMGFRGNNGYLGAALYTKSGFFLHCSYFYQSHLTTLYIMQ